MRTGLSTSPIESGRPVPGPWSNDEKSSRLIITGTKAGG
jgi:hypothetical protein